MYGFVDDTKLEDCSHIKKEGNKIPSLGSEKNEGLGLTGEHAQVSLLVKGARGAAPLSWVLGSSLPSLSRRGSRSCITEKVNDHQI